MILSDMTAIHEFNDKNFDICYGIRPYQGEVKSGDEVVLIRTEEYILIGIIDGLGHGKAAYDIAQSIKKYIEEQHSQDIETLVQNAHQNFKGSRGAVIGLAKIQNDGQIDFIGIGNISCKIINKSQEISLLSKDGALGIRTRNICTIKAKIEPGAILVMYSDGIGSQVFRNGIPALLKGSKDFVASLIAEFGKKHDDVSLIFLNKKHA